ncbi:hypothetical protein MRB53_030566 [Persea americana]|uniref:Uncharacterized protein n=1 Tax=Persea americana TaxID=3435 RepID=A0ACC2KMM6_PERAE|nr:hypothetical protein MRB53_030566 [Persea americana]
MIQPPQVMKQIDETFVSHIDNILNHEHGTELEAKQPRENGPLLSEPSPTNNNVSFAKACEVAVDDEIPELVKVALSLDQPKNELHTEREYKLADKRQCFQAGLRHRAKVGFHVVSCAKVAALVDELNSTTLLAVDEELTSDASFSNILIGDLCSSKVRFSKHILIK